MEKGPQDESRILSDIPHFAATLAPQWNSKNINPVYDFVPWLLAFLEADQVDGDAFHGESFRGSSGSRIGRVVRK